MCKIVREKFGQIRAILTPYTFCDKASKNNKGKKKLLYEYIPSTESRNPFSHSILYHSPDKLTSKCPGA